jgi:metallo-beta-lactamase class B
MPVLKSVLRKGRRRRLGDILAMHTRHTADLLLGVLMFASVVTAQNDTVSRSGNQPIEPFRIAGNLYYVGASEVTSFLITTPRGHILIDGGFEQMAPIILANIERLGFRPRDVRILLNSHAHVDHAGGLAALQRDTGARFIASRRDLPLLARGGRDDPQFGDRFPFPAIVPAQIVEDGGQVRLGGVSLTAHITAGHTPGCTTWTMALRDGGRSEQVVFVGSPSVPVEYKLSGNRRYPDAIEDYRRQFAALRALKPDLFLGSHGSFFNLNEKIAAHKNGAKDAFVDPAGYRAFVEAMEERFEARVAQEQK